MSRPLARLVARRAAVLCSLLAAVASAACGNALGVRASLDVVTDTLSAFALTGTPLSFPVALATGGRSARLSDAAIVGAPAVVRLTGTVEFDVVFDIDAAGNVVVSPNRLIVPVQSGAAGRRVGLQRLTSAFDSVSAAPRNGYVYDSTAVAITPRSAGGPSQVLVIQAQTINCSIERSPFIHSKLVVDSVSSAREIFFRITTDPNCGFRSFLPGVPRT